MLAMLSDIKAPNHTLSDRMTKLEQQSLVPSSPVNRYPQPQLQVMRSSHRPQFNTVLPHIHYNDDSLRGVQNLHQATGSDAIRQNNSPLLSYRQQSNARLTS